MGKRQVESESRPGLKAFRGVEKVAYAELSWGRNLPSTYSAWISVDHAHPVAFPPRASSPGFAGR